MYYDLHKHKHKHKHMLDIIILLLSYYLSLLVILYTIFFVINMSGIFHTKTSKYIESVIILYYDMNNTNNKNYIIL